MRLQHLKADVCGESTNGSNVRAEAVPPLVRDLADMAGS